MGFAETRRGARARITGPMDFFHSNHASFGKTKNPGAAGNNIKYNGDLNKTQMTAFLDANAKFLEEHGTHRPQWQIDAHLSQLTEGRTAGENAAYNARDDACFTIRSHVIPRDPDEAKAWFDAQEKADRVNARMSDRMIEAFPRKFSPQQCSEIAEDFCKTVTKNQIPWHFALHLELDKRDTDDWNPHAHIIFRDRHVKTGLRHLYTSAGPKERAELNAKGIEWWDTRKFRRAWADAVNRGFERYGIEGHVDYRSYKDQGLDKVPGVHLGPKANALKRKGIKPTSKDFSKAGRTILYTLTDNGTRADHNEQLKQASPDRKRAIHPDMKKLAEKQSAEWWAMRGEQKRDRAALRSAHNKAIADHKKWAKGLYAEAKKASLKETKEKMDPRWKAARSIGKLKERNAAMELLKLHQKVLYANADAKNSWGVKKTKDAAYRAMMKAHIKERDDLSQSHAEEYKIISKQHLAERVGMFEKLKSERVLFAPMSQSMAAQQRAALRMIKPHAPSPAAFFRFAHGIADKLKASRAQLNAQRQSRMLAGMTIKRRRSQAGDAMQPVQRAQAALLTGQTLTDADKLNASPEQRQQFTAKDRKATKEAVFTYVAQKTTGKGRDRGGGGRGR